MIVPMKKVLLLALESDSRNALEALRDAGVMQIVQASRNSDDTQQIIEKRSRAERILMELEKQECISAEKCSLTGAEVLEKAAAAVKRLREMVDG